MKEKQTNPAARAVAALYLVGSFGFIDVWLRVLTRWIGRYSIYAVEPNLFTLCWAVLLTSLILIIPGRVPRRVIYGLIYFTFAVWAAIQYGDYLIFHKFMRVSDLGLAEEGIAFASFIKDIIRPTVVLQAAILIIPGILGIIVMPAKAEKIKWAIHAAAATMAVAGMLFIPCLYDGDPNGGTIGAFMSPAYENKRLCNPAYDIEIMGLYQYTMRDVYNQFKPAPQLTPERLKLINDYFASRGEAKQNEMTGIFKGKNLIFVMMESIDDWLVTESGICYFPR